MSLFMVINQSHKRIYRIILLVMLVLLSQLTHAQEVFPFSADELNKSTDKYPRILVETYPDHIVKVENNKVYWTDGTTMVYDDNKVKDFEMLIEYPDVQDQFIFNYSAGKDYEIKYNVDPGRVRNKDFFEKMYGSTREEVERNLVTVIWLPNSVGKKISFSKVNGASKQLMKVSEELDEMPEFLKYLNKPGGTYNWRYIAGTDRLSAHSFGIAIDINVDYSNYWKWDAKGNELEYRNKIPIEIVEVFEKYGFIWGGKWYHYDTMHFEYRPELMK